ncbi:hypothetical protein PoB_005227800 [Plakobranchus ocellatus]|uniref:Uncharacterized protein n=1 Tax=Plakobranchus ocellatus TaxID=259542 RepID=A0AAV4C2Y4_9GAST|nr:hypothetical protein PoB_005227800 [Plakobranchus ocellatus]
MFYIKSNFPQHHNENYKADKLKRKLISFFGSKLQFWQRYGGSGDLVYSEDVPTGQAEGVAFDYATTEEECVVQAALILRKTVLKGFEDALPMKWPPSLEDLKSEGCYPDLIKTFLTYLYTKQGKVKSESCKRRVDSTAQDICFNVTKGRWKLPKHILLGMAVPQQLVDILYARTEAEINPCDSTDSTDNLNSGNEDDDDDDYDDDDDDDGRCDDDDDWVCSDDDDDDDEN